MRYKTSPKFCYMVYSLDGKLVAKGRMDEILTQIDESEFCVRNAVYNDRPTSQGHIIKRYLIDYDAQVWDLVDTDGEIVFTGKASEIKEKMGYKTTKVDRYYAEGKKVGGRYRIVKHGEHVNPDVSMATMHKLEMLKIYGKTCGEAKTIDKTVKELKMLGVDVVVEPSVIFKGDYVLTMRR